MCKDHFGCMKGTPILFYWTKASFSKGDNDRITKYTISKEPLDQYQANSTKQVV